MSKGHEIRWGGFAGLGALVLALIGGILLRNASRLGDSAGTITDYIAAERGVIMTGVLLYVAAVALFLWFGATLATAFRLADPDSDAPALVLAGFTLVAAVGFVALGVLGGFTYTAAAHPVLLALAPVPYVAVGIMGTLAGMMVALALGASAVAIARTGVLPQWIAWFAGIVAVIRVLEAITVVAVGGAVAPGSIVTTYVPGGLTGLWILAVSWLLVREHLPVVTMPRPQAAASA